MEVLRCPACSGVLDINNDTEIVQCRFCGNSIRVKVKRAEPENITTFVDKATNMVLGTASVPADYQPACMIVPNASSYSFPIVVSCSVFNAQGNVATFFSGEAFTDATKCPQMTGMYSTEVNRIGRVSFKNFVEAEKYVNDYAISYVRNAKGSGLKIVEDRELPMRGGFNKEAALEGYKRYLSMEIQRSGNNNVQVLGVYQKPVCRIFEFDLNGLKMRLVIATIFEAVKYGLPGFAAVPDIGSIFGGLFGGQSQTSKDNGAAPGTFGYLQNGQIIEWRSNGVFMLQSLSENFDKAYSTVFTDFVSTYKTDTGISEKCFNMQSQILRDVANYTQQNIRQQQQNFQAWQQINRTQQEAFDSYNRAWWARENSTYQANRARSQASFNHSSPDFSEAIRGVNTYVREDGSEVEVSVAYDRAYTNNLGDTLGSNSAFEPGGNWTEMQRK